MGTEKSIVVTSYGHEKTIDKISISLLDSFNIRYCKFNPVESFCNSINSLELKNGAWIFTRTIEDNNQYFLNSFLPSVKFIDVIPFLDSKSLQRVLREVDPTVLAIALKNVSDSIKEVIFKNMTQQAIAMLKKDLLNIGNVKEMDSDIAQEKIIGIIFHLESIGEIVIRKDIE